MRWPPSREQTPVRYAPPPVLDGDVTTVILIDMLWARFLATGEAAIVTKIAALVGEDTSIGGSVAGYARWTLISNVRQHPRVREIVEQRITGVDPSRKRSLEQVLAEADRKP